MTLELDHCRRDWNDLIQALVSFLEVDLDRKQEDDQLRKNHESNRRRIDWIAEIEVVRPARLTAGRCEKIESFDYWM